MEQKTKYEELGWELTTEATAKTKAPAPPKKRKRSEEGEGTPVKTKKPCPKKAFKPGEASHDDDEDPGGMTADEGVKEEQAEEFI